MNARTIVPLLAALGLLVILPLFLSPNLLNAAIKMMIAALFALAFALAMGQAGMLSFGHSAYYGLGAFAALHLMRAVEHKLFGFPTPMIPLAGALIGFLFGLVFGWFATQRTGVYFSMVTLALAELLFTLAPTWNALFGGESGISTIRGPSWGINFGSDADVYYLTLGWFVVSAWCMWAFTKTPVGRLALALRDNEQRVRFLGFNTHVARTLIFAISCLFTGVAGALLAIANEAANYTIFSAQASANVVLQTFIGGAGTFFGPALGAMIMTFFARITSDLTRSWLLYQGLIFVLVMLFAPQGLGGLADLHARKVRTNGWKHLVAPYLLCLVVGLLLIAGLVFVVESIHVVLTDAYLAKRAAAKGEWVPYELFGQTFEPFSPVTWAIPIMLVAIGSTLLPVARRITARAWLAATRDVPDEPIAPSASAAPVAPPS
ncbi:branched-chain amino acid ABC transporter permease [Reyranella soli]|uniref:branched-chain amino acid ABC transporter permease n=1 Tax=Reyranella soli TaxID=1230389 RepID=UPI0028115063|nr:branched-chain amino acid ABC transporter permease [Reyranella soli]